MSRQSCAGSVTALSIAAPLLERWQPSIAGRLAIGRKLVEGATRHSRRECRISGEACAFLRPLPRQREVLMERWPSGRRRHPAFAWRMPHFGRSVRFSSTASATAGGLDGEVAEWSKAHAWNACRRATVSRVRIPLSPPLFRSRQFRFAQRLRGGGRKPGPRSRPWASSSNKVLHFPPLSAGLIHALGCASNDQASMAPGSDFVLSSPPSHTWRSAGAGVAGPSDCAANAESGKWLGRISLTPDSLRSLAPLGRLRAAPDTIEAMDPIPADYTDDSHWPSATV